MYILQTLSLSEDLPTSKLDLLPWILSRIIWHLAKSRSQGPSTLLCISQFYHCRTTISRFTYHECLYEFCLTYVVQLRTYLKNQQFLTSCTILPLTLLQETFLQNTLFLTANNFAFV